VNGVQFGNSEMRGGEHMRLQNEQAGSAASAKNPLLAMLTPLAGEYQQVVDRVGAPVAERIQLPVPLLSPATDFTTSVAPIHPGMSVAHTYAYPASAATTIFCRPQMRQTEPTCHNSPNHLFVILPPHKRVLLLGSVSDCIRRRAASVPGRVAATGSYPRRVRARTGRLQR